MLKKILVNKEIHPFGGFGTVYSARSEELCERLLNEHEGKIQLIYLDPPFGTGGAFEFKDKSAVCAYTDNMRADDLVPMMKTILTACHKLLCASGSLYLHVDYRLSGRMRLIMDEIFGEDNFMNEIIWSYRSGGRSTKHFSRKHDNILFYRKSKNVYFNIEATGSPRGSMRKNHMKRRADDDGRIYYSIKTGGKEYRYYEDDLIFPSDVWDDIEHLHQRDPERTGFNTQKPLALLKRVVSASSERGDTVLDFFGGSGTTAAAAQQLGRRFISCDSGLASLFATRRRLIEAQRETELFIEKQPFTVEYADPESSQRLANAEHLFDSEAAEDGRVLRINKNGDSGCAFCAVGKIENGIFSAYDYSVRPKSGETILIPSGHALHIVNSSCEHGFFTLD
ncbi:MAG: site-specific DNA-methyltransferase [Clostridia bacterium]|nr:site-specific DNA-methyltransferase [Clostridia bacterium]